MNKDYDGDSQVRLINPVIYDPDSESGSDGDSSDSCESDSESD